MAARVDTSGALDYEPHGGPARQAAERVPATGGGARLLRGDPPKDRRRRSDGGTSRRSPRHLQSPVPTSKMLSGRDLRGHLPRSATMPPQPRSSRETAMSRREIRRLLAVVVYVSPFAVSRLPLSSMRPGPIATTSPSWGFSLAVSGMTRPEAVVCSASSVWTTMRSSRGLMLTDTSDQPPLSLHEILQEHGSICPGSQDVGSRSGRHAVAGVVPGSRALALSGRECQNRR